MALLQGHKPRAYHASPSGGGGGHDSTLDVWLRQRPKPPPWPSPKGREIYFATSYEPRAIPSLTPRTTNHAPRTFVADIRVLTSDEMNYKLQATSHKLQATCRLSPIRRRRPDASAEIRGPCRTNRQDSVAAVPFATSYAPRAIPPPPRTTNQVPRTNRADTRVLPYEGITHHEPQATGHEPVPDPHPGLPRKGGGF